MEKNPVTHYMLPQTYKLLMEDIKVKEDRVKDISREGASMWEGDQWHSTTYRQQQQEKEVAIRLLQLTTVGNVGDKIEILPKPTQTDIIAIGHMVQVLLADDEEVVKASIPYSLIHVLTSLDYHYLSPLVDSVTVMVIPHKSPLGQALLGLRRGSVASYGRSNQRLQVLNTPEAIRVSSLFEQGV